MSNSFKTFSLGLLLSLAALSIIIMPVQIDAQSPQQKHPSQDEMMQMMGTKMEDMLERMFKVLAKPENAERLATFTRNYYDALIAKGFSKEEALQMTMEMGMPALSGMN